MEYLRKYLIEVRRIENTDPYKFKLSIMLLAGSILGVILGFIIDSLLGFYFVTNTIRGIIALATGIVLFTYLYLMENKRTEKRAALDSSYVRVRNRFSFRQRVNFSIVASAFLFFVIMTSSEGPGYTFKSSLLIVAIISLVAFCRRRRSEFIKSVNEIPDVRDMRSEQMKIKKLKENRAKREQKKEKNKKWYNKIK